MKGPVPNRIFDDLIIHKTGDVAMTTPGRCYDCNTRVGGPPLIKWRFDCLDAKISLWACPDCYGDAYDDDWSDSKKRA